MRRTDWSPLLRMAMPNTLATHITHITLTRSGLGRLALVRRVAGDGGLTLVRDLLQSKRLAPLLKLICAN